MLLTIAAGSLWSVYSAGIGALAGHWLQDRPILGAVLGTVLAVGIGLLIDRITAARSEALAGAGPDQCAEVPGAPRTVASGVPRGEASGAAMGETSSAPRGELSTVARTGASASSPVRSGGPVP